MNVLAHLDIGSSRVELVPGPAASRSFRVTVGPKTFSATWEPQETGSALTLDARAWAVPSGAPIDDADWTEILAAIEALRPRSGGVASVLEWRPSERCYLARSWDRGPDGFLVSARDGEVDYLELGRTLRVSGRTSYDVAPPEIVLDPSTARWLVPPDGAPPPAAWAAIHARLVACSKDDFVVSSTHWKIR
ncbi:MAG TPA: hypothetical protein VL400_08060 [Polyangiaceae bacterium]|jgi:hypothetical protein|nr:hypothetical protein [Polyangiaceae bacterium]